MPYTYHIYPEQALAVIEIFGDVTGGTYREAMQAVLSDAQWQPGYDRLWDERQTGRLMIDEAELWDYAEWVQSVIGTLGGGRSATVAEHELARSIGELYRAVLPWEVVVFGTLEEALAWLDKQLPGLPHEVD